MADLFKAKIPKFTSKCTEQNECLAKFSGQITGLNEIFSLNADRPFKKT